jgi:FMN-dependent NADH-azoreductase
MHVLHIDSSITGDLSISRRLTARTVAAWVAANPDAQVQYLDLASTLVPHFGADALSFRGDQAQANEAQRQQNKLTETLLAQFLAADVIVIGAPLYNFGIPTQLKAWIDRLAQPGRSFSYGEKGPVGLAGGKTVIVVLTRGGIYSTSEAGRSMEHQESYLQTVLNFFGITDVRFVRAEGLAMGADAKAQALAAAEREVQHQTSVGVIPAPEVETL